MKRMNRDDQNLNLLYQILCRYEEIMSFSHFCKRMNGLGSCVDVNCDVLIFAETLVHNIKSKCMITDYRFFAIIQYVNDAFEFDECEYDCNLKFFCHSLKSWFDDPNIVIEKKTFFMRQCMQYPKEFEFIVKYLL